MKNHGGKRKGAGRPATGPKVKSSSISMSPALWQKLDELRGGKTRSKWIADKIKRVRAVNDG